MITNRIATLAATAVTAGAFALVAFSGAATASAGSVDDQFLKNIAAEGISFDSAKGAISDAQLVCSELADGNSGVSIATEILDNSDLTTHQAAVFVVEASTAYCPKYLDELSA
jgi:hypothetical protein